MENQKKNIGKAEDLKPVSRPSNEEIEDDIADNVEENAATQTKKFHRNKDLGQGVED